MPSTTICRGNILYNILVGVTITPAAVLANITAEQSFTVQGLQVNDYVQVAAQAAQTAGVGVVNARVTAANTLTIAFCNFTSGTLTPVAGSYSIEVNRPENLPLPTNAV